MYRRIVVHAQALQAILAGRDFRKLFAVRLVGQFSDGLLQASLATFVLFSPERQPNAVTVASAFAILLLPYSIIGPFAGVFLDRWSRRNVLVRANLLKALFTIPIIALVFAGDDGPVLGIAVLLVLAIGRFVLAALSASLPHVVQGQNLVTANALTPTTGTILVVVGGLVGVGIRELAGGGDQGSLVVLTCAIAFYIVAGLIASRLAVHILGPDGTKPQDTMLGVVRGLIGGVRVLRAHRAAARSITVVGAHRIAFGALTVGSLLLVRNTFNPTVDADAALGQFTVITAVAAAGAIIGAVITPALTRRIGAVVWSTTALFIAAIIGLGGYLVGSTALAFWAILVGSAAVGLAGTSVKINADTAVQRDIPDDHLGRVFALFDMIVNVCLVTGVTLMAFTAPTSGRAYLAYVALSVLLAATGIWYIASRRTRLGS
jgi:MFS-type transporter involved in bile tolerance (Atg22 family)